MTYLLVGILLWWVAHLLKRLVPAVRLGMNRAFGDGPAKGVIALVLLLSVVLMIIGYRMMGAQPLYQPLPGMGHANNLLMLVSIFLLGAGSNGGRIGSYLRHPMLLGIIIWSVAHLLVNGDMAPVLLFGGLGSWAVVEILVINRIEGIWQRPQPGSWRKDAVLLGVALLLYALIAWIHSLFGFDVFQGNFA